MGECGACGNKATRIFNLTYCKGVRHESCDKCGARSQGTPDVYFKGSYVDEHLSSEEFPGPKTISSRQEKAYWLKKCNLRESGDRHHGATSFDPISHRHAAESLERGSPARR